jgi:L-alanine-DL-glutamate epimerase-like enolase superfamily enzyme
MTALAAVEIALWDIEGKRLRQPIWRLTGASAPKPMRVYYSHWSQELNPRTPERVAELAAKTRAEGWTCLKCVLPKDGTEPERLRRLVAEGKQCARAVARTWRSASGCGRQALGEIAAKFGKSPHCAKHTEPKWRPSCITGQSRT